MQLNNRYFKSNGMIQIGRELGCDVVCPFRQIVFDIGSYHIQLPIVERFPVYSIASIERVSTHWQLLWEDTRYKDGLIPDESEYFLDPEGSTQIPATSDPGEVRTGERCPVSGLWTAKGYEVAPIKVSAGTVMPDLMVRDNLGGQKVHWVTWQLVKPFFRLDVERD
jgi:hypothetical protein